MSAPLASALPLLGAGAPGIPRYYLKNPTLLCTGITRNPERGRPSSGGKAPESVSRYNQWISAEQIFFYKGSEKKPGISKCGAR